MILDDVYEMYFVDGMKEQEIADSLGVSLLAVHEALTEIEQSDIGSHEVETP